MTDAVEDPWAALTPTDAQRILRALPIAWWIAGGWALELAGVDPPRAHADVDIAVLRPEHEQLRTYLAGWDLRIADDGRLQPWTDGPVEPPANGVWARPDADGPWFFDFKVERVEGGDWVYRRDETIRMPLARIGRTTATGIPYLAPEVTKLYARRDD